MSFETTRTQQPEEMMNNRRTEEIMTWILLNQTLLKYLRVLLIGYKPKYIYVTSKVVKNAYFGTKLVQKL